MIFYETKAINFVRNSISHEYMRWKDDNNGWWDKRMLDEVRLYDYRRHSWL
jgi:hypothetical protein